MMIENKDPNDTAFPQSNQHPQKDVNCINITCLVKGSHSAVLLCLAGQDSHVSSKGITLVIPLPDTWRDRLLA